MSGSHSACTGRRGHRFNGSEKDLKAGRIHGHEEHFNIIGEDGVTRYVEAMQDVGWMT